MTYEQLTTGYLWCVGIYSFGSIALLALRHREHINFKIVRAAMVERKKPEVSPAAQAKWNRESTIVGRIGAGLVVGWVFIMFFGRMITSP